MSHTDKAVWVCPRCGMRRYRFRACAHCALFEQNWATGTGAPAEAKVVDAPIAYAQDLMEIA